MTKSTRLSLPEFQWPCGFKDHTLELLYTCEYTQGERPGNEVMQSSVVSLLRLSQIHGLLVPTVNMCDNHVHVYTCSDLICNAIRDAKLVHIYASAKFLVKYSSDIRSFNLDALVLHMCI